MNRLGEGAQLVIALFQLILVVALRHDSTSCLEPEFAIAADEGTDYNRLVQIAIQADESDATTVGSTIMRFQFGDNLHRSHLWRTAQGAGWEGIDELLDVVGILIEGSAHTAHQVDDVAIKLHILIEIYLHTMAVAAQVVARQIYQHHVLGILLRVVAEELGSLSILLHIACATGGSGYRVNKCLVAHDAVVGFWRRAEDAESAEIEIEEIWRWVDAAQGTIELEVIALVFLDEAAADNNLEDIAPQTVLDALADVRLVLLVGKGRKGIAHRMEIVRLHIRLVHGLEQSIQLGFACGILEFLICYILGSIILGCLIFSLIFSIAFAQGYQFHCIIEVIEHDDILIHYIIDIRRIILLHGGILYGDILEISHGVEGGEAIESAEILALAFYEEALDEIINRLGDGELALLALALAESRERFLLHVAIRIGLDDLAMTHGDACQRMNADERSGVLGTMIVGTLHQSRLGINISQSHIDSHRRIKVGKNLAGYCRIIKLSHFFLID